MNKNEYFDLFIVLFSNNMISHIFNKYHLFDPITRFFTLYHTIRLNQLLINFDQTLVI